MELRLWYAIGASLVTGVYGFLQKVESESDVNKNAFIFYSHIGLFGLSGGYFLWHQEMLYFDLNTLLFALITNVVYVIIMKLRIKSLQYIDTSTYFINYRIFTSICLLIAGQIIFSEQILFKEYLGIFLGFVIFYLLLEKKEEHHTFKDMWKGILYLGIGILGISFIWVNQKFFTLQAGDFWMYIFYSGVIACTVTVLLKGKDTFQDVFVIQKRKDQFFLFMCAIFFSLGFCFNILSVAEGGKIGIVYKIVSYSIFIPIFGSMIFYHEKITIKKIIAFLLTIVSILLFA